MRNYPPDSRKSYLCFLSSLRDKLRSKSFSNQARSFWIGARFQIYSKYLQYFYSNNEILEKLESKFSPNHWGSHHFSVQIYSNYSISIYLQNPWTECYKIQSNAFQYFDRQTKIFFLQFFVSYSMISYSRRHNLIFFGFLMIQCFRRCKVLKSFGGGGIIFSYPTGTRGRRLFRSNVRDFCQSVIGAPWRNLSSVQSWKERPFARKFCKPVTHKWVCPLARPSWLAPVESEKK